MSILDDLNAVYDKLNPTIWYIVSEHVPPGKALTTAANTFFPEVYYFHPDNWAQIHRELADAGCRLRDFRSWRPAGATKPTIIEGAVPCPRCGTPLNNVAPGISVVAGGVSVCTPCLRPGETESARARGLTNKTTE